MRFTRTNRLIVAGLLGLLGASHANAAKITWSMQSLITGDSNVNTQGSLVYAYSLGNNVTPSLNGVTFSPAVSNDGSPDFDFFDGLVRFHNYTQYTGFSAPDAITPGSQYANLLTSAGYAPNAGNDMVLTLGVTSGQSYLVQLWANDARGAHVGATETLTDSSGGTAGNLTIAQPYATGFGGNFITGIFTADANTQVITIDGNDEQQINALQLRNVTGIPEPSSALLLAVAASGFVARRRRTIA